MGCQTVPKNRNPRLSKRRGEKRKVTVKMMRISKMMVPVVSRYRKRVRKRWKKVRKEKMRVNRKATLIVGSIRKR